MIGAATFLATLPPDAASITALIVLFIPLFSFVFLYFFGRILPGKGDIVATLLMGIALAISLFLFFKTFNTPENHLSRFTWFTLGVNPTLLSFNISLLVTPVASMMLVIVTLISFLVHLYSLEYMEGKRNYLRYFPYLGLFTFSMIGVILSDNLLITFCFWELVGFASYLLIGFWFEKDSASKAAKKAFIINRVGDVGFLIGLLILWAHFDTLDISILQEKIGIENATSYWMLFAGIGLFCGTVGKSAQFPLQTWLPDAMEGPTPVSALIHAATMVAAGVYLLFKVFFLLSPVVLTIIAIIGAITAIMGAYAALVQYDIKKVLAFSTISQLGYMVMAVGIGAWDAALFHLLTHAFFKACLFLSAGAIIHGMHHIYKHLFDEGHYVDFSTLDMRLMGGFRKKMPVTFYAYTISALSLIGLPLFSGFLSKDAILIKAMEWAVAQNNIFLYLIPISGFITVILTGFYMGRQLSLVFFNNFRLGEMHETADVIFSHLKDVSWKMKLPLIVLALMSLWPIFSPNPFNAHSGWFLSHVSSTNIPEIHILHSIIPIITVLGGLIGLYTAWRLYAQKPVGVLGTGTISYSVFYLFSKNNFYLDKVQKRVVTTPVVYLSSLANKIDLRILDRILHSFAIANVILAHLSALTDKYLVDGFIHFTTWFASKIGSLTRSMQKGQLQNYLLLMALSMLILLGLILI